MDDRRSLLKLVFVGTVSGRRANCFEVEMYEALSRLILCQTAQYFERLLGCGTFCCESC